MPSFWNKAAKIAADLHGGNDGSDTGVIGADFGAEPMRRSIRRDPPPPEKALSPTDDELRLRLADEIEYARRILASMGDELASDALMSAAISPSCRPLTSSGRCSATSQRSSVRVIRRGLLKASAWPRSRLG